GPIELSRPRPFRLSLPRMRTFLILRSLNALRRRVRPALREKRLRGLTVRESFELLGVRSPSPVADYLLSLSACLWPSSPAELLEASAEAVFTFLYHHGLLAPNDRAIWQQVVGGIPALIVEFQRRYAGELLLGETIETVRRLASGGVTIRTESRS